MLVCLDVDFRSSLYCSSQTDLFIDIFIFFFLSFDNISYSEIISCVIQKRTWQSASRKQTYIMLTPLKSNLYIVKLGFTGVYIIFLFLLKNIDCGYLLEPPCREIRKILAFFICKFSIFGVSFFYIFKTAYSRNGRPILVCLSCRLTKAVAFSY